MTPAQVAAPVQLEALPVTVRGANGESIARQEIWSPRAALGQSLRLVQLLALRTLMCSRGGHANISCVKKTTQKKPQQKQKHALSLVPSKLQHKRRGASRYLRSTPPSELLSWKNRRETRRLDVGIHAARFIQRVAAYPVKVEGRQSNEEGWVGAVICKASRDRDPRISPSTPRVGKLLCAPVTRVRNNGAHLNFITQREESADTKQLVCALQTDTQAFISTSETSKDQRLTTRSTHPAVRRTAAFGCVWRFSFMKVCCLLRTSRAVYSQRSCVAVR